MGVAEHLVVIGFAILYFDIGDVAQTVALNDVFGVDEALVGSEVQGAVACEDFGMELGVNFDAVGFDQVAGSLKVPLAFDALNLSQ